MGYLVLRPPSRCAWCFSCARVMSAASILSSSASRWCLLVRDLQWLVRAVPEQ